MKKEDVSGVTSGHVIDADAVQAANNTIRRKAQRDVIVAKEVPYYG